MGKVIKFPGSSGNNKDNSNVEEQKSTNVKSFGFTNLEEKVRTAVEEYIKSTFAVREILGMDLVFKENKNTIGILGVIAYEHKRKPGTFVANFIGEGWLDNKKNVKITEVAFEAGEPDLYRSIYNTLKAKKALPEIK